MRPFSPGSGVAPAVCGSAATAKREIAATVKASRRITAAPREFPCPPQDELAERERSSHTAVAESNLSGQPSDRRVATHAWPADPIEGCQGIETATPG